MSQKMFGRDSGFICTTKQVNAFFGNCTDFVLLLGIETLVARIIILGWLVTVTLRKQPIFQHRQTHCQNLDLLYLLFVCLIVTCSRLLPRFDWLYRQRNWRSSEWYRTTRKLIDRCPLLICLYGNNVAQNLSLLCTVMSPVVPHLFHPSGCHGRNAFHENDLRHWAECATRRCLCCQRAAYNRVLCINKEITWSFRPKKNVPWSDRRM